MCDRSGLAGEAQADAGCMPGLAGQRSEAYIPTYLGDHILSKQSYV